MTVGALWLCRVGWAVGPQTCHPFGIHLLSQLLASPQSLWVFKDAQTEILGRLLGLKIPFDLRINTQMDRKQTKKKDKV